MARQDVIDCLKPLDKAAVQPYFSKRIQLADLIEWVLDQFVQADICISTFSTSEEFLRRLYRLKRSGRIGKCRLFCDLRAARKTVALKSLMQQTFDHVSLCENHSKVVILSSDRHQAAIVTSQNQTRGDRYESGIITTDGPTIAGLLTTFEKMSNESIPIDALSDNS